MEEIKAGTRRVIKISRKRFVIGAIVIFLVIVFLVLVLNTTRRGVRITDSMGPTISEQSMGASPTRDVYYGDESYKTMMPDYYDGGYGYGQPTITDTREFLKTSYSATIKTRDVTGVTKEVSNIVKGADGRVDNFFSSEKSGRVSFVVAKSKFDALRDEIEAITHQKLYVESISSQNLLSQKQGIEAQTSNIVTTLDSLNKQKEALLTKHNQTVSSINSELDRIQTELTALRAVIANTTDSQILVTLRNQETTLVNQDAAQRQKLSSENNSYSSQKKNLENQITNYNNNLANVNKQDVQFTDNIETVNGYVSVNWVSIWQLAEIFSPVSPIIIIIVLIVLVWLFLSYKKITPVIEWE